MTTIVYDLDTRLKKTLEYCKNHRLNNVKVQNYLADGLYRYILPFNDNTKLIDCVKYFHLNEDCIVRYNELVDIHKLDKISENVRLLLIHAIYIEKRYRKNDIEKRYKKLKL